MNGTDHGTKTGQHRDSESKISPKSPFSLQNPRNICIFFEKTTIFFSTENALFCILYNTDFCFFDTYILKDTYRCGIIG